jgi:hypothetical protein
LREHPILVRDVTACASWIVGKLEQPEGCLLSSTSCTRACSGASNHGLFQCEPQCLGASRRKVGQVCALRGITASCRRRRGYSDFRWLNSGARHGCNPGPATCNPAGPHGRWRPDPRYFALAIQRSQSWRSSSTCFRSASRTALSAPTWAAVAARSAARPRSRSRSALQPPARAPTARCADSGPGQRGE